MPSPSAAEEHLRVIRSLMEKATIYRAISAQAALFAGSLACLVAIFFQNPDAIGQFQYTFFLKWSGVLIVSAVANFFFLHRDARRRGESFRSAGMRMALRAMAPPLLCGGCIGFLVDENLASAFWILFYGLALLSTVHFAPRSLERLGYGFTGAGLVAVVANIQGVFDGLPSVADLLMGATFGLFHLLYAACTWPRTQPESAVPASS